MALKIISDVGADLSNEVIEEYGVEILPMPFTLDGVEYEDNSKVSIKEFFDKMRAGAKVSTSQVPVAKFTECYERHAENGDSVIDIVFSSGLSGSYNAACLARDEVLEKYPDFDITVIDSKCASMGFGLVVYKALLQQKEGASKEEIIDSVIYNSKNMQHIFTVDDLEYLFRGGRVSRAAAIMGGILGIKPVLHLDTSDGKLHPLEKVRGRRASIKRMADMAGERLDKDGLSNQLIGISHGDDMQAVEELKEYMTKMYGCKEFMVNSLGPVIGAHSGPGTLAVFFVK